MKTRYRPSRFYLTVFALTWGCWLPAALLPESSLSLALLFLGLCVPAVTALCTVLFSKDKALKTDLKRKLVGFARIHPGNLLGMIGCFALIVAGSICLSTLFGQSLRQFAFTEGFSFSVQGSSALLTILLASVIEEMGWRGYGEDSIAQYHSWFWESIWFGLVWSLWHVPLFLIPGTYHAGLLELGPLYAVNFLISVIPLGFLTTLVYVRNNRSMLACILFHVFVNFFQEKIALTPQTKCVETLVITLAAVVVVATHRHLFFETDHVGRLLEYQEQ